MVSAKVLLMPPSRVSHRAAEVLQESKPLRGRVSGLVG